ALLNLVSEGGDAGEAVEVGLAGRAGAFRRAGRVGGRYRRLAGHGDDSLAGPTAPWANITDCTFHRRVPTSGLPGGGRSSFACTGEVCGITASVGAIVLAGLLYPTGGSRSPAWSGAASASITSSAKGPATTVGFWKSAALTGGSATARRNE